MMVIAIVIATVSVTRSKTTLTFRSCYCIVSVLDWRYYCCDGHDADADAEYGCLYLFLYLKKWYKDCKLVVEDPKECLLQPLLQLLLLQTIVDEEMVAETQALFLLFLKACE